MPITTSPRDVVEEYFSRLARRDESAFDLVAEDFIRHDIAVQGRHGVRQSAYAIDADLGRPVIVVHHVVASDDLVCIHLDLVGTHVASSIPLLRPVTPTGKGVTWSFLHLFRVVDGLMTEHWSRHDDLGLLAQLRERTDQVPARPGR